MRNSAFYDIQFWIAVVVGWTVCGMLWSVKEQLKPRYLDDQDTCPPCRNPECPECYDVSGKAVGLDSDFHRDYPWKPRTASEEENNYWMAISTKKKDGMVNEDPRVGTNGMWRLERIEIENFLQRTAKEDAVIAEGGGTLSGAIKADFKDMKRKFDPFYGISYIVDMEITRAGKEGGQVVKTTDMFEVRRGFKSGQLSLIDIKHLEEKEVVHIITPLSKVTERFHRFMERLEQNLYRTSKKLAVRLIFVIFGLENSRDSIETVRVLQKFQLKNPTANMKHVFVNGEFSRAIGLDTGAQLCDDDDLMLFLDVDLSITPELLNRIRANTIHHKRVTFPVMFSQFDPQVIETYMKTIWVHSKDSGSSISEDKGFWIYYAFGVASMYKTDYLKVGGFRLDITGWGGEDVDLFKKMIADGDLDVMTTVDPDLIHIYHSRSCDVNLSPDQYRMCIGAMSETIGSKMQIGALYLKHKEMKP